MFDVLFLAKLVLNNMSVLLMSKIIIGIAIKHMNRIGITERLGMEYKGEKIKMLVVISPSSFIFGLIGIQTIEAKIIIKITGLIKPTITLNLDLKKHLFTNFKFFKKYILFLPTPFSFVKYFVCVPRKQSKY
jgi:hypothetical protein